MRTRTAWSSSCSSRSRFWGYHVQLSIDNLLARRTIFGLTLLLLRRSGFQLRFQLGQMRRNFGQHRFYALNCQHGAAAALFHRGDIGANFAGQVGRLIAALAERLQIALRRLHLLFQHALLLFVLEQFAELRG